MGGRSPCTLCHPLFPHCGSCPPAAASNKLGTVVAGKGGGGGVSFVHPYFSFSIQKSAGHLFPKIEEDRSCANRWFQEHFPQEQGFSSTIALKLWPFFFHCSPVSFFNRADDQRIHKSSVLHCGKSQVTNQAWDVSGLYLVLPARRALLPVSIQPSYLLPSPWNPIQRAPLQGNHFPSTHLYRGQASLLHILILALLPSLWLL